MTAVVSLVISLLTTGFVSATISYDWDTDPKQRAVMPDFYGFVPDSPRLRTVIFVTMMSLSVVQVLLKTILIVCLGSIKTTYIWFYIGGDIVVYLGYKLFRGDFRYWVPIDGAPGLVVSGLIRVLVKTITDYAGIIQFRHPYELGGLYFMLNLFTPIIGLALVLNIMDEETFERDTTLIFLKNLALSLGGSFLVLVSLFFALMENKYRKTFFSTESGGQLTRRLFLEGDNNMKASVFGTKKTHWMPVRDKMASWIKEGWATWEDEKPEWFTDMWKASVPEDMKPAKKTGDVDGGRSTEIGQEKNTRLGEGKKQTRQRSIVRMISAKKEPKILPAEGREREVFDKEEFAREYKRMGRMDM
ncbi:hypothetical protein TrST_g13776 [Triparma strigata]|nr:hypothetical protein TrST_g13776 [Triparma strigata]